MSSESAPNSLGAAPADWPKPDWSRPGEVRVLTVAGDVLGWAVTQGSEALAWVPLMPQPDPDMNSLRQWVTRQFRAGANESWTRDQMLANLGEVLQVTAPTRVLQLRGVLAGSIR